jgi:hypothetical protein
MDLDRARIKKNYRRDVAVCRGVTRNFNKNRHDQMGMATLKYSAAPSTIASATSAAAGRNRRSRWRGNEA